MGDRIRQVRKSKGSWIMWGLQDTMTLNLYPEDPLQKRNMSDLIFLNDSFGFT